MDTRENIRISDSKNESSLEDVGKIEESIQICEIESTSLNDPMNWSIRKKQFIVFIVSAAGTIAPLSSTIFFPAVTKFAADLNISQVFSNTAIIAVFILFMGIAPLGWSSYSDFYETRRQVYLLSLGIYVIASIIFAFLNNIWLVLVMRSLQACGGSAVQSIGAGTISDVFHPLGKLFHFWRLNASLLHFFLILDNKVLISHKLCSERGRAFGWFYLGLLVGTVIGPTLGGYITQYLGLKFISIFLSIYGGAILVVIYFALPETFRPAQLSLPTTPPKKRFNPLLSLALFRYPNLYLTIFYVSVIFSTIYVQNTLIPIIFSIKFNLSPSNVGLVLLSPGFGYFLGSVVSGKYSDSLLAKSKARHEVYYPEKRINSVWFGATLIPVSLLAYGWFITKNVHIALPILAMFFFGFGTVFVINCTSTYLIDAFPGRSASAIAVTNFSRSIAASIMSIASAPLENTLGTGLLYTILTAFIVLSTFCIVIVYFKGKEWREHQNSQN